MAFEHQAAASKHIPPFLGHISAPTVPGMIIIVFKTKTLPLTMPRIAQFTVFAPQPRLSTSLRAGLGAHCAFNEDFRPLCAGLRHLTACIAGRLPLYAEAGAPICLCVPRG